MCDLASIALISTIGSEIAQIGSQNAAVRREIDNADLAYGINMGLLNDQATQINQQFNLEAAERARQALRERGRLMAAMGEAGIAGNSPMREIANTYLQQSYDLGIIKQNQENALAQNTAQRQSLLQTTQARIADAQAQYVSPWLAALRIGSASVQALGNYQSMQKTISGQYKR